MRGWFSDCATPLSKEIIFIAQIFVIVFVIVVSIINLSLSKEDTNLWTILLSSSFGYILPNPRINKNNTNSNLKFETIESDK